ncbi:class 1b ribonucleoside-diphosphate reductase subunit beta [Corynebacterium coyleae]|uniref:class 1b ribonucleoside-diphosphate reductase subunit beta n=1 Tax=Corynebacterium coyleae TaxID=53374 RepID=UPI001CCBA3F4|nr:class 1b ribonucleoside-diphosphate reductase subunit beta [Corynebacterium coyleae]UBI10005.1 class 1b ribonucleoside-diphosphate reductase subunit beta [Corynebacterium coyleae]
MSYKPVNWNRIEDPMDLEVWDRLTSNFWLDTKVAVSNDLPSWRKMNEAEKEMVKKVFASLTLLDTLQSEVGAPTLARFASTQHEEAVFNNIAFMESVHAKSYSTIFSTLCSTKEIDEILRWAEEDDLLQKQVGIIRTFYKQGNPSAVKVASVFLESFLFYTGFFAPLKLASEGRLTNTADIIRLIMRDEGVHGFYIGHKFQREDPTLDDEEKDLILELLHMLYANELLRCQEIYDEVGWTEDVKKYLRYNANKALANLGLEPMFAPEHTEIPAYILSALDISGSESHDFFSGSGASYVVGKKEATDDGDWAW